MNKRRSFLVQTRRRNWGEKNSGRKEKRIGAAKEHHTGKGTMQVVAGTKA
jgi:hypothetical protein